MTKNFAFNGEDVIISVQEKGSSGSQELSARITNVAANGFTRNISQVKNSGGYMRKYDGWEPASIQIDFVYDLESPYSGSQGMFSFVGSSSETDDLYSMTTYKLSDDRNKFYKLKFEMTDNEVFGTLDDNDEALKILFYNTEGLNVNSSLVADGVATGNISFFVTPFNSIGSSNYLEIEKPSSKDVTGYINAEDDYDTEMGY